MGLGYGFDMFYIGEGGAKRIAPRPVYLSVGVTRGLNFTQRSKITIKYLW
jgi:hypothetical protein